MNVQNVMNVGIVGAGHNGLVCAYQLANAGHRVTIFESRSVAGGLCVTEEVLPGFRVSTVASYYGMLREEIAHSMRLQEFGLETYLSDPVEIVLLADRQYSFTPRDGGHSQIKLEGATSTSRQGWTKFWGDIQRAAAVIYPYYLKPQVTRESLEAALAKAGLKNIAAKLIDGTLLDLLDEYVDNDGLKTVAATCTPGFCNQPGTVFGCIHHGTAKTAGQLGAWGFVRGGMGKISEAMLRAAVLEGVEVIFDCPVRRIHLVDGVARGIELSSGEVLEFDVVISNADPWQTLEQLVPGESLSAGLGSVPSVSAGKVHLALSRLPKFPLLDELNHNYQGVIVSAPPLSSVLRDSEAVANGAMPEKMMMTLCLPSTMDDTIAPEGKHLLTVDIHYLPNTAIASESVILEQTLNDLEEHVPDLRDCIEASYVVSPHRLRTDFNLRGGSCWHLPIEPRYLIENRNCCGEDGHRTHIKNLYLCGAGTFPSGNVTGAPGFNCAQQILGDRSTPFIEKREAQDATNVS